MVIPIWKIYSYWVFAMTALWCLGWLPFSPLVSAIAAFVGSALMPRSFILVMHLVPLWILRKTHLDVVPNVAVFLLYNALLVLNGTNYVEVYSYIYTHQPTTLREYLSQRGLKTDGPT